MRYKHYVGIRTKIAAYTILCVVAVGMISNLFLFQYMRDIIEEKIDRVDTLYAKTIAAQIDYALEQMTTLQFYCVNAEDVVEVLQHKNLGNTVARKKALAAQSVMNSYLRTSPVDTYINKLLIFNESGVIVHALSTYSGAYSDLKSLLKSEQYQRFQAGELQPFDQVYRSINHGIPDSFVLLSEVYASNAYGTPLGYVYAEIDPRIVTDILTPYNQINRFFVQSTRGSRIIPLKQKDMLDAIPIENSWKHFEFNHNEYSIQPHALEQPTLTLASCINQTDLQATNQNMGFSLCMVLLMIFGIVIAISITLTQHITKPIRHIMDKINKISLNDYSFDPELERPNNEMGEVGARLNELGLGIQKLLDETIALHDERSEIEMALLQSQVNPHFLYNTLNSVHYMAVMQKNIGIEKLVRSLVNLLKNVSKGVSDQIPLSGELELLKDYVNIQSVRYMGAFDYICQVPEALFKYKISKFTLQPLVENAILHGVVPKVTFGTITIDAKEEGEFLLITVEDDGVGMSPEEATTLLTGQRQPGRTGMNGIGLGNVNRRIKLAYGSRCGLSVESEQGCYTRITVRIPKEQ